MGHTFVCGMTGSGKTRLTGLLFQRFYKARLGTAILDPMHDERWRPCSYKSADLGEFSRFVWTHKGGMVAVDEGASFGKFNGEVEALLTRGRHLGHSIFFLTQRPTQTSPVVRDQCSRFFVFPSSDGAIEMIAKETRHRELLDLAPLQAEEKVWSEYYVVGRFIPVKKFKLVFRNGISTPVRL